MKIEYDTDHDLLNIEFLSDVLIDDSLEIDGIVIDYAKDKRIVAIEVLDASKRTTHDPARPDRPGHCSGQVAPVGSRSRTGNGVRQEEKEIVGAYGIRPRKIKRAPSCLPAGGRTVGSENS